MLRFNKEELRDKILACWIGKNIGGTMGGPYEWSHDILDIQGFSTPEGEALPNDDLDLQIVWLKILEERGPRAVNGQLMGEYWLNFIPPTWNEYGIGKSNLMMGLLPPLSGEYKNYWKNSNGAWIRSEIWACCTPGCPDIALHYAVQDAMVDHGMAEGTYAEMFTASIQSAAFVCDDIQKLIQIGLSKIPENCRVAKSINTVLDCHKKGIDWKECRQMLVKENEDLGMFQAPQNIAFTVLGLLYGNCDFKKSMILAINCGDDTDCTAATCGALLGIMGGMKAIPEDWREHIGDRLVTVAINRGDIWGCPQTCTELTDRILAVAPQVLYANRANAFISDSQPSDISEADFDKMCSRETAERLYSRPAWSYEIDFVLGRAMVIFDGEPVIKPNGELKFRISVQSTMPDPRNSTFKWHLPEGWSIEGPGSVYLRHWYNQPGDKPTVVEFTLTAGDRVESFNRLIVEIAAPGRPTVGFVPVTVLG